MNVEKYRQKLIAKQNELLSDEERAGVSARQQPESGPLDTAERSVVDETLEELFLKADRDAELIQEIHAALARIAEGTYGRCVECGKMIEVSRLDAVPWTPYCVKHQKLHEPVSQPPTM